VIAANVFVAAALFLTAGAPAGPPLSETEAKLVAAVGAQIERRDDTHVTITKPALDTLVRYGRPLVGRTMRIAPGRGVTLFKVHPDGICARFGFQAGDVVTTVNRVDATTMPVVDLFVKAKPGDRLVVAFLRAGQPMKIEIRVK